MEPTTTLPAKKEEDLHYIWNKDHGHFDIIDMSTGLARGVSDIVQSKIQYSLLMADIICERLRNGETLTSMAKDSDMPSTARVYAWLAIHPEFKKRYDMARKQRAEAFQDKALEIALSHPAKEDVPAAKLAVDTLKWAAEKNDPDRFGKKDEGPKQTGGVHITLHTGVLDTSSPKDIIVDEYGNFKGFDNGTTRIDLGTTEWSEHTTRQESPIGGEDRWTIREETREFGEEATEEEGSQE